MCGESCLTDMHSCKCAPQILRALSSDTKLVNVARRKVVEGRIRLDKTEDKFRALTEEHKAAKAKCIELSDKLSRLRSELEKGRDVAAQQHARIQTLERLLVRAGGAGGEGPSEGAEAGGAQQDAVNDALERREQGKQSGAAQGLLPGFPEDGNRKVLKPRPPSTACNPTPLAAPPSPHPLCLLAKGQPPTTKAHQAACRAWPSQQRTAVPRLSLESFLGPLAPPHSRCSTVGYGYASARILRPSTTSHSSSISRSRTSRGYLDGWGKGTGGGGREVAAEARAERGFGGDAEVEKAEAAAQEAQVQALHQRAAARARGRGAGREGRAAATARVLHDRVVGEKGERWLVEDGGGGERGRRNSKLLQQEWREVAAKTASALHQTDAQV
jgi:hypothetical protein